MPRLLPGQSVGTLGPWGVFKAAIKAALKFGYAYLPKPIKPLAGKILDVLETLDNWVERPIITALMAAGIPYDVARAAAFWVVTLAV